MAQPGRRLWPALTADYGSGGRFARQTAISSRESSYEHHLKKLIDDLLVNNYLVNVTDAMYNNHNDVGKFFPDFLKKVIGEKRTND